MRAVQYRDFDESQHPRNPVGPGGGQFTSSSGGASSSQDGSAGTSASVRVLNEQPIPPEARRLQNIVSSGRYTVEEQEPEDWQKDRGTRVFEYWPNDVDGLTEAVDHRGRKVWFDERMANVTKVEGRYATALKGEWSREVPAERQDGVLFRGMSAEEYGTFEKTGKVQSVGDMNFEGQKGLTYFSADPQSAAFYASAFAPEQYKATPTRPAYVVAVKDPGTAVRVPGTGEDERGIPGAVAREAVIAVYRGAPYEITSGQTEIIEDFHGVRDGSATSIDSRLGWKRDTAKGGKAVRYRDYDESQHPRDEHGRWSSGDGGGSSTPTSAKPTSGFQTATAAERGLNQLLGPSRSLPCVVTPEGSAAALQQPQRPEGEMMLPWPNLTTEEWRERLRAQKRARPVVYRDFDEDKHPRDEDGKFSSTGGGGDGPEKVPTGASAAPDQKPQLNNAALQRKLKPDEYVAVCSDGGCAVVKNEHEENTLHQWTNKTTYQSINEVARGRARGAEQAVTDLDRLIERNAAVTEATVYRGVRNRENRVTKVFDADGSLTDHGFSSWSGTLKIAQDFAGPSGIILERRIRAREPVPSMHIGGKEDEYVTARSNVMRMVERVAPNRFRVELSPATPHP